jgi:hypothetical protein
VRVDPGIPRTSTRNATTRRRNWGDNTILLCCIAASVNALLRPPGGTSSRAQITVRPDRAVSDCDREAVGSLFVGYLVEIPEHVGTHVSEDQTLRFDLP